MNVRGTRKLVAESRARPRDEGIDCSTWPGRVHNCMSRLSALQTSDQKTRECILGVVFSLGEQGSSRIALLV